MVEELVRLQFKKNRVTSLVIISNGRRTVGATVTLKTSHLKRAVEVEKNLEKSGTSTVPVHHFKNQLTIKK